LIKITNGKQSLNSDGQQFYQHLQSEQPTVTLPQTTNSYVTSNKQQLRYLKQPTVTLPQTNISYVTSNNQQLRYLKQPTITLPQTTNSYITSNKPQTQRRPGHCI
jgi:hypothetical protein